MNVEKKSERHKNVELIFDKLHLNPKLKFRIFVHGSYSLSFIPHVILFLCHSQSLIPHFSNIEKRFRC